MDERCIHCDTPKNLQCDCGVLATQVMCPCPSLPAQHPEEELCDLPELEQVSYELGDHVTKQEGGEKGELSAGHESQGRKNSREKELLNLQNDKLSCALDSFLSFFRLLYFTGGVQNIHNVQELAQRASESTHRTEIQEVVEGSRKCTGNWWVQVSWS